MGEYSDVFVAFDVAKRKPAVAVAEGGRAGEVRFLGDVENNPLPGSRPTPVIETEESPETKTRKAVTNPRITV